MAPKLMGAFAAVALLANASSAVAVTTAYTYSLNGTLAEDSGSGPSLVAYGGTLTSSGYYFGPNLGLSLSNAINPDVYSIDIHFYFDSVSASSNGFQRIIDFKNRTTDSGLYSKTNPPAPGAEAIIYNAGSTSIVGNSNVFFDGQFVDLRLTRSATGQFSAYVNGALTLSFLDSTKLTTFSGAESIVYLFMDDLQSIANYPNTPEAGSGLITFLEVTSDLSPVPLPPSALLFVTGLGALASFGWWRKRKSA